MYNLHMAQFEVYGANQWRRNIGALFDLWSKKKHSEKKCPVIFFLFGKNNCQIIFSDTQVINDEVNNFCYPYELPGDCEMYESSKAVITIRPPPIPVRTTTSAPKATTKTMPTPEPTQKPDPGYNTNGGRCFLATHFGQEGPKWVANTQSLVWPCR